MFLPSPSNCAPTIKMFFGGEEPEMALQIWYCMVDNGVKYLDTVADACYWGFVDYQG